MYKHLENTLHHHKRMLRTLAAAARLLRSECSRITHYNNFEYYECWTSVRSILVVFLFCVRVRVQCALVYQFVKKPSESQVYNLLVLVEYEYLRARSAPVGRPICRAEPFLTQSTRAKSSAHSTFRIAWWHSIFAWHVLLFNVLCVCARCYVA